MLTFELKGQGGQEQKEDGLEVGGPNDLNDNDDSSPSSTKSINILCDCGWDDNMNLSVLEPIRAIASTIDAIVISSSQVGLDSYCLSS